VATRRGTSFPIGKYRLDVLSAGIDGLTEFSPNEYAIYGRQFKCETNYHAPAVDFLGLRWEIDLGTVNGMVYKVAACYDTASKENVIDVTTDVMAFCSQRLGPASEGPTTSDDNFAVRTYYIWDMTDGNLVVQFGRMPSAYTIHVFETSKKAGAFERFSEPASRPAPEELPKPAGSRKGGIRLAISLAFAAAAAYAFSFALDLLFGAVTGVYPGTAYLPAITWFVISAVGLIAARSIRNSKWLALPYIIFGALAVLGGVAGSRGMDYAISGLMFVHAFVLWQDRPLVDPDLLPVIGKAMLWATIASAVTACIVWSLGLSEWVLTSVSLVPALVVMGGFWIRDVRGRRPKPVL
jgi:hypothetical protein